MLQLSRFDLFVQKAKNEKIPLVVHDESMVKRGALFSYGYKSRQVGFQAATLAEIRLLQKEGAPDLVEKVVSLYLADAPETIAALGDALERRDAGEISRKAHKLKSSSANIGALQLASLLAQAELLGREGRLEDMEGIAGRIREEYAAVNNALEAILAGKS